MHKQGYYIFTFLSFVLFGTSSAAQDTLRRSITLPAVSVSATTNNPSFSTAPTPSQHIETSTLQQTGSILLSDAVRQLTGVTLKDYGGIGGVKTVSSRGLGSQFSTLTIDGIAVSDAQNGQIDLGRYMLAGNSITLDNGQSASLLQSARALSAGNILELTTQPPQFLDRPFRIGIGADMGSFGYISPTISYSQRLGNRIAVSFWGNYTRSDGDYPFTLYYTHSRTDSSSTEYRQNSQMHLGTADLNLFYRIDTCRRLHLKAHYMQGFHALPGPVIYYAQKGSEHTDEQLFFLQGRYHRTGDILDLQLLGKYQHSRDAYTDTAVSTLAGSHLHNDYDQQEAYLSQALLWHPRGKEESRLHLSIATDESISQLQSNLSQHNDVQRASLLGSLSAEYRSTPASDPTGLRINAHLLGTWIRDYETSSTSSPYAHLSPYAGLSYSWQHLTLRYFFKETYRVPNFNELYYFTVGRALRPEKAHQHNIGISFQQHFGADTLWQFAGSLSFDSYYNHISDKIIAIPTQNMFLWSMANLGIADILGIDATANLMLGNTQASTLGHFRHALHFELVLGYSYQHAVDHSDPTSKSYGNQIPYTPRHSGNITLTATNPWVNVGYTVSLIGERYCRQQNNAASRLEGYVDQGITLSHDFLLGPGSLKVKGQILNLFNVQYEVVKNYPMMGRNYRIGINYEF